MLPCLLCSCGPHQPDFPATPVLHLFNYPSPVTWVLPWSALPPHLNYISFISSSRSPIFFFLFFLAYQLFPCAQSFSTCTSSPQWYSLYLSPVLCSVIVKSLIMCPWSCHVCLFQLLILNKLYPLIFLGSLSLHSMFRECLIQHGIGWLCHSVEEHHYQQFVLSTYPCNTSVSVSCMVCHVIDTVRLNVLHFNHS